MSDQDNQHPATATDPNGVFTPAATDALLHAISCIPGEQLTPRSMLMLKVRFELVRLLMKHQLDHHEPEEAVLAGIAATLTKDLFPNLSLYSARLPPKILAVVAQVTGR